MSQKAVLLSNLEYVSKVEPLEVTGLFEEVSIKHPQYPTLFVEGRILGEVVYLKADGTYVWGKAE